MLLMPRLRHFQPWCWQPRRGMLGVGCRTESAWTVPLTGRKLRCNSTEAPVSVPVTEWLDILKGGQMVISAFVVACVALMPGVLWSREWLC